MAFRLGWFDVSATLSGLPRVITGVCLLPAPPHPTPTPPFGRSTPLVFFPQLQSVHRQGLQHLSQPQPQPLPPASRAVQ